MVTPKTAVQGGNKAYFCEKGTTADGLGIVLFTYDKLSDVSKTSHPKLGDYALALTNNDLTSTHETFVESNLVEVSQTDPIVITYTDNTEDRVAEAPSGTTEGFLVSVGGVVNSTSRRLYVLHGYLATVTESSDSANTPVNTVDSFVATGIADSYTLTSASIDLLFSDKGTIAANIALVTGDRGKITYLTVS